MKIGGFIKQTLIDYPGNIASVVFTNGCNFRCGYCHNADLVVTKDKPFFEIPINLFFEFIHKNNKLLDAVVITGGEPTLSPQLIPFIKEIKKEKLKVKLDTNGTNPNVLNELISSHLIDYIAMDVKTSLDYDLYNEITGGISKNLFKNVEESIYLIINSGLAHEFRTTLLKEIHSCEIVNAIAIAISGADKFCLQMFDNKRVLNPLHLAYSSYSMEELEVFACQNKDYVKQILIR